MIGPRVRQMIGPIISQMIGLHSFIGLSGGVDVKSSVSFVN